MNEKTGLNKFTESSMKWMSKYTAGLSTFTGVMLAVLVIINGVNVIMRYLLKMPLSWSFEISLYLMLVIVLLTLAESEMRGETIKVDILTSRLRGKKLAFVNILSYICAFFLLIPASFHLVYDTIKCINSNCGSETMLQMPYSPLWAICTIGIISLCIVILLKLLKTFGSLKDNS